MKIDVFEGSRRIALLLQAVWVIGCIAVGWNQTPFVSLTYETRGPSAPFVKAPKCAEHDAEQYRSGYKLEDGKNVSITLCFKAQPFANGSMLVPYRQEGGQWWGNDRYSSEVVSYTEARAEQFRLSVEGRESALEEWRKERRNQIWITIALALGGWISIALVGAILGWIVRGFLGIPRRKGRTPEPSSQRATGE